MLEAVLEKNLLPDRALRLGIRRLLRQRLREEGEGGLEASHDRFMRFLGGGFEQHLKPVTFAEKLLDRKHGLFNVSKSPSQIVPNVLRLAKINDLFGDVLCMVGDALQTFRGHDPV